MTDLRDAREVPLHEQLRRVPKLMGLKWTDDSDVFHSIPIGQLAHAAADRLAAQSTPTMTDHNPSEGDIVERLMQDRLMNPDYATRREAADEITRLRELLRISLSPAMNEVTEAMIEAGDAAIHECFPQLTLDYRHAAKRIYLAMHSAKEG